MAGNKARQNKNMMGYEAVKNVAVSLDKSKCALKLCTFFMN